MPDLFFSCHLLVSFSAFVMLGGIIEKESFLREELHLYEMEYSRTNHR